MANANQQVVDNRFEYTGNGVLVVGATDFLVARNVVYRTWQDAIHVSHDSHRGITSENGRVLCNVVRENGDDMIAVIGYGIREPILNNILIEGNDVSGSYWGSGVGIEGARDITIRRNTISHTAHTAGIRVGTSAVFRTSNTRNILVEDNEVNEVQTSEPVYNPLGPQSPTRNAAIDISGQASYQEVSHVLIKGTKVTGAIRDGIRVRGNAQHISLDDNQVEDVGRSPIRIEAWEYDSSVPLPQAVSCSGNTSDGAPATDAQCTSGSPSVVGAKF
jgi:hypothetical protein